MSDTGCTPCPPRVPSRWPVFTAFFLSLFLIASILALHLAPDWALRWRQLSDRQTADAAYLRRQAELKAEADAADQRLDALDRRVQLVSLGFREVARKVAPVVVHISNEVEVPESARRAFYDIETNRHYREQSAGSGLLVRPGLVLTNEHVVQKAQRLRVTFASGRYLLAPAEQVSTDKLTDLAVIRLPSDPGAAYEADYAAVAEFADSDRDVQVGDWVLAAGSPFGLKQTVTAGIISAKGRVDLGILDQVELLQTDAAIHPGNSGGPLFDQRGRVAGVNVAIATERGRNEGVGFAIPSNTVREVFDQLADKGEVVRGFLGVRMQEVPEGLEHRLGVGETGGVIITQVEPDSPADAAGLRKADIITRFNSQALGPAHALNNLRQRIARTPPETPVSLEVFRRPEHLSIEVTLAKRPPP